MKMNAGVRWNCQCVFNISFNTLSFGKTSSPNKATVHRFIQCSGDCPGDSVELRASVNALKNEHHNFRKRHNGQGINFAFQTRGCLLLRSANTANRLGTHLEDVVKGLYSLWCYFEQP